MIDTAIEQTFSLAQSRRRLPNGPSYETVRRWSTLGASSASGRIVKLDTILTPTGRHTSVEAFHRFMRALNEEEV